MSKEISAIIVLVLTQVLGQWFTESAAAEIAVFLSSLIVAGYLWAKRYARGDITPLGAYKV